MYTKLIEKQEQVVDKLKNRITTNVVVVWQLEQEREYLKQLIYKNREKVNDSYTKVKK